MNTVLKTLAIPAFLLMAAIPAGSESLGLPPPDISRDPVTGNIQLRGPGDADNYYILERSSDLMTFAADALAPGSPPPQWQRTIPLGQPAMFYRLRRVPRDQPLDTDGDGIDDLWELEHPLLLNPLDPDDATKDPDGDGKTHLDDYLAARRHTPRGNTETLPDDAISLEVSVFNFGEPSAAEEAISQEVSLYNGETPPQSDIFDATSREVSVFNSGEPTGFLETISHEVSVFNFGSPPASVEAISQEVSLYNGETPPRSDIFDATSREISIFNSGEPAAVIESISREVSVFNNLPN